MLDTSATLRGFPGAEDHAQRIDDVESVYRILQVPGFAAVVRRGDRVTLGCDELPRHRLLLEDDTVRVPMRGSLQMQERPSPDELCNFHHI